MRIISGTARGKQLATFSGKEIRPTPDRVREAVFSLLFSRHGTSADKRVLDLFAGTGAMALEALSRGCAHAVLIDQGPQSATLIPQNLRACRLSEAAEFIRADVLQALPRLAGRAAFDLIFLDPPYNKGLQQQALEAIARLQLLAPKGIICVESARDEEIPESVGPLQRQETRHYGSTAIHIFSFPNSEADLQ